MGKVVISENVSLDGVMQSPGPTDVLIEMGIVDEIALTVYPLILGTGERLFDEAPEKTALELVRSRPVGAGVVSMVYAPVAPGLSAPTRP